ncbi:hypothetical protein [Thomasclavelia cocleata]|uniref:hypothetical protein n=1 Tax=Thomasclavelia cocleata TaxID=69824 RepID=UPI002570B339|nr:hypothetical protein [Thomasclavelia cocleata]
MKQLDIFGNEIDIELINAEVKKQRSGRLSIKDTFRKLHGYNKNHYCKNCIYFICSSGGKRNYYKCKKIGLSNSDSTDIRLKDYACDLFKRKGNI